jgi:AcrR family transcriptional regulator
VIVKIGVGEKGMTIHFDQGRRIDNSGDCNLRTHGFENTNYPSYSPIRFSRTYSVTPSADRTPRKQPQQDRSRFMRDRILAASLRVLADEGALGFTTTRVADEAGISVGSLYQYFPNKHALVAAIHDADIALGWAHVQMLLDAPTTPRTKVAEIVEWFFVTESQEAKDLGGVGGDMHVFLRESVATKTLIAPIIERLATFIAVSSSAKRTRAESRFAADLAFTTIETLGNSLAARQLSKRELEKWARATAAMLCDTLDIIPD